MYNYLKCKYELDLSEDAKNSTDREWESLTYVCDSILGKVGEFLIRKNGELCHSVTEYESVDKSEVGKPNVIWNGSDYAKIKNTEWVRVDFNGTLNIETQIIDKKTDASVKVEFEFVNGYVVNHTPNILLIDNSDRLKHDKKIKEIAIKRATKLNSKWYRVYDICIRTPLIKLVRSIGYIGSYLQDFSWKLERQLNKR